MNNDLKGFLVDIVETCIEAVAFIKKSLIKECFFGNIFLLDNIIEAITHIQDIFKKLDKENQKYFEQSNLYCSNILYFIEKIKNNLGNKKKCYMIVHLELFSCCCKLKEVLNFNLNILPNPAIWNAYNKERELLISSIAKQIGNNNEEYKYQVSIIFLAYNKLEYTKKAIESIYKYTDFNNLNVELITINNGSSDGTKEYFDSLPNEKKINLKYNILGLDISKYIAEGKYIVGYSNDVIATKNWLQNLLYCIKSDTKFAYVVPTCNDDSISNKQGTKVEYKNSFFDMEKMQAFAEKYNHSRPELWEERSLLMPFVILYPHEISYFPLDGLYTMIQFSDDDLSTSLRRAGLKQILAKDTFLHHFGSITLGQDMRQKNSLGNMREVYYKKWGVDAWESRGIFNELESCLKGEILKNKISILVVEPRFGGSLLQVKNYYRKQGQEICKTTAVVLDQCFFDDAKGMFDQVTIGDSPLKTVAAIDEKFDLITFGKFLPEVVPGHIIPFLEVLYQKLNDGGMIICPVKNYRNTDSILQMIIHGAIPSYENQVYEFSGCSLEALQKKLSQHTYLNQYSVQMVGAYNKNDEKTEKLIDFVEENISQINQEQRNMLKIGLNSWHCFISIQK